MGTLETDNPEEVIDTLVRLGVTEAQSGENLQFPPTFVTVLEEQESFVVSADKSEVRNRLHFGTGDELVTEAILDVGSESNRLPVEYLALAEYEELSHFSRLQAFTVSDQFYSQPPPSEGSPDAFLPVRGDRLPFLFELCDPVIVYIWLRECPPCDLVREDFDGIFSEQPADIGLFSLFGPNWSELLQEKYDVTGGPTTLFVENGSIDYRVYKAPSKDHLLNECQRYTDAV
jgi:thiol-disulfide isomerase/thioredoxin